MTFQPTEYNIAIRDEWRKSNRNIGIKARAGSGKTSQLLWMAEDVEMGMFISFSASIVQELKVKLEQRKSRMVAKTGHALGRAACVKYISNLPSNPVNNLKYFKIAQAWVDTYGKHYIPQERRDVTDALKELTDKAMLYMLDGSDLGQLYDLASHYDIQTDQYMVEGVKWVIDQGYSSNNLSKFGISFSDMLYLPVMHDFQLEPIETLFFDECLPYHTPVLLADGTSKDIGEIVDNKLPVEVLAYDINTKTQKKCKVTGWSKILNQKPLVKIKVCAKGRITNFVVCTVDHKIFVDNQWIEAGNVKPGMIAQVETSAKKSNFYKITSQGRKNLSKLMYDKNKNGVMISSYRASGVKARGGNGKGLTLPQSVLLNSLGDGWEAEHVIPTGKNKGDFATHYKIDIANKDRKIAIEIDGKSHYSRKEQDNKKDSFLKERGWRVFRFTNQQAIQNTLDCVREINFCNGDDCPVEAIIVSVESVSIKDFFVYDIEVEDCHNFYANGILVHNCQDVTRLTLEFIKRSAKGRVVAVGDDFQNIFSFAGVSPNAFYDVMDTFDCVQMPLNYCYRCGKNIIKLAQTIVPDIQSPDWMHDGEITRIKKHKLVGVVKSGDAILCRTNAPLINTCLELISHGIKAHILGREVGKTLAGHIKKIMKLGTWSEFLDLVPLYVNREVDKILRKSDYSQSQVDYMTDVGACILAVYQQSMLNEDILIATINALFDDDDKQENKGVTLSTVHKAKGREWDRVFIINPDKLPLIWADQKPHEYEQEKHIEYVAYTRPKFELCFVE